MFRKPYHAIAPEEIPFPSTITIVKRQVTNMMHRFALHKNAGAQRGQTIDRIMTNTSLGSQYASLEIEARLGTLRGVQGDCLYDDKLIMPTVLEIQSIPQWNFVPSLNRTAFGEIKSEVKKEIDTLKNRAPNFISPKRKNGECLKQSFLFSKNVQVLPVKESMDLLYDNKLRVSYCTKSLKPTSALTKVGPEVREPRDKGCNICPTKLYPEPLICIIPKTKVVVCFNTVREEYMPVDLALSSIRKNNLRLKRVRWKKCASVILGRLWRIDMKTVETWNIPHEHGNRDTHWFLDKICSKSSQTKNPPKISHEVELELSPTYAGELMMQDTQRKSSDRFGDLIESFVHNAQGLASLPQEYSFD